MPEALLGEILGNKIGKNGLLFYQTTKFAVSAWIFD